MIRMIPGMTHKEERHTREDIDSNMQFKTLHNSTVGGFYKNEFYTIGSVTPEEWVLLKWTDKFKPDGEFEVVA